MMTTLNREEPRDKRLNNAYKINNVRIIIEGHFNVLGTDARLSSFACAILAVTLRHHIVVSRYVVHSSQGSCLARSPFSSAMPASLTVIDFKGLGRKSLL